VVDEYMQLHESVGATRRRMSEGTSQGACTKVGSPACRTACSMQLALRGRMA
jgi:hypothetical protein